MKPIPTRRELILPAIYTVALWINVYICRDLFSASTAYMISMHGFWTAMARFGGESWGHPSWWPYWDCGIPFEYTYAPLVPAMAAAGRRFAASRLPRPSTASPAFSPASGR